MFVVGYYIGFTFVRRHITCQIFSKDIRVNNYIFCMMNKCSIINALNLLSVFELKFDRIDALSHNRKNYIYGVCVVKKWTNQESFVQI